LVVCGEYDLDRYRRLCDELVAAVPSARGATIAGSAHCPQLDQPGVVDEIVLDFIATLDNPR